jgi:hypothetical protein
MNQKDIKVQKSQKNQKGLKDKDGLAAVLSSLAHDILYDSNMNPNSNTNSNHDSTNSHNNDHLCKGLATAQPPCYATIPCFLIVFNLLHSHLKLPSNLGWAAKINSIPLVWYPRTQGLLLFSYDLLLFTIPPY